MNKNEYIRLMLLDNINTAKKTIEEISEEIDDAYKLPNDCMGIIIDGQVCENKDLKIDLLTSHYHVTGYMECLKFLSEQVLSLNSMNDDEFQEFLIKEEEIERKNKEEMIKLDILLNK